MKKNNHLNTYTVLQKYSLSLSYGGVFKMIKRIKQNLKKIVLILMVLFYSVLSFSMEKIKVQFKWKHQFQFAGYYAAKENGYYKKNGMDVEFLEYLDKTPVEAVVSGKADFGVAGSEIIIERAKGKKIVLLASIFQHSPYIFIAKKESGIESIHEIAGKTVAIDNGASELMLYLKTEGINIKKINIVENPFDINPFIEGKIDVTAAYSTDELFHLKEHEIKYTVFNPRTSGIDFYGDSLFTTEEYLKKNPEIVEKFVKESIKGWKYALENKKEITEIILGKYSKRHSREHLIFEAEETEKLIMPNVVDIGYFNKERWLKSAELYKEMGMIPNNDKTKGFFYNSKIEINRHFIKHFIITLISLFIGIVGVAIAVLIYNKKLKKEIKRRIKIEEKLKEKEKRYKLFAENTVECIWLLNITTMRFEYISPSIFNLRGLNVEEAMTERLEDSLTPESLETVRKLIGERVKKIIQEEKTENKNAFLTEIRQYKKDRTIIDVEVSTKYIYDEKSKEIKVIGVSRDITERKKIEIQLLKEIEDKKKVLEKISKSEKKLKELLMVMEEMPISVLITDVAGKIEYVNRYLLNVSGYERDEIIGKTPRIFKSGIHPISFYKEMWREIINGKQWRREIVNEKRNGEKYKEMVTITPVKDEKGEIYNYIAIKELIEE
jgi:PAS domain S-box-containing protein